MAVKPAFEMDGETFLKHMNLRHPYAPDEKKPTWISDILSLRAYHTHLHRYSNAGHDHRES